MPKHKHQKPTEAEPLAIGKPKFSGRGFINPKMSEAPCIVAPSQTSPIAELLKSLPQQPDVFPPPLN